MIGRSNGQSGNGTKILENFFPFLLFPKFHYGHMCDIPKGISNARNDIIRIDYTASGQGSLLNTDYVSISVSNDQIGIIFTTTFLKKCVVSGGQIFGITNGVYDVGQIITFRTSSGQPSIGVNSNYYMEIRNLEPIIN